MNEVLKKIIEQISDLNYCLVGSLNLKLHDIDISARDIDILTDENGIEEFAKRFKQSQTKNIYFDETDGRNSLRSFYKIDDIEIEVLANVNNLCRPKDELKKLETIDLNGVDVKCSSLKSELIAYKKMGRTDKAELIQDHLSS